MVALVNASLAAGENPDMDMAAELGSAVQAASMAAAEVLARPDVTSVATFSRSSTILRAFQQCSVWSRSCLVLYGWRVCLSSELVSVTECLYVLLACFDVAHLLGSHFEACCSV
jgi:hypothetical protein